MASKVFLHVGAPLAGSRVREVLATHRRRLTRLGVLYPPGHLGHDGGHRDAVLDVLDLSDGGSPASAGAWDRLAETVRDWRRGTAVVSHELLADADDDHVARVVASFGDAEVHVVYVAQGLAQQVPEAWQQWVHHGGTAPFSTYAARVLRRDGHRMSKVFWRSHDVPAVLGRWLAHVPADRVHLVTVPPDDDGTQAWTRFAQAVGLDTTRLRPPARQDSPLAPLVAGEVVRLANLARTDRHDQAVLTRLVQGTAALEGAPPRLPATQADVVETLYTETATAVRSLGVDVVGDLGDLTPDPSAFATSPDEVEPGDQAVIAAQTQVLLGLAGGHRRGVGPAGLRRRAPRMLSGVRARLGA